MRERLIELLNAALDTAAESGVTVEHIADHLLDNGVIVSPVNVGQTVYRISGKQITGEYGVYELGIDREYISDNKISVFCHKICDGVTLSSYEVFTSKDIGKTVFLTREAAEAALKARENK